MHQTIDLLYNVTGQSLYFDAPEGRPSSVTSSTVYQSIASDDGTAETATTGSAAVATNPNTTFNATSGFGDATDDRRCRLALTTGINIGGVYLATNAKGAKEFVEIVEVSSGSYATAREPLTQAYASADTFVTTRITHAIDSTWVADKNKISNDFDPNPRYRWRLVYVVSSVTYVHDLYVDLLRYAGRHDVLPTDVEDRSPGWLNALEVYQRVDQGRRIIEEAYTEVKFDLFNASMPDQGVRNREVINELVRLKAIESVRNTEDAAKKYASRFAQLIDAAKVAVSKDSTGASGRTDPALVWVR